MRWLSPAPILPAGSLTRAWGRFQTWARGLPMRWRTFRSYWKEARCSHAGAREWVSFDYHETIGASAMECSRCGLYWDQTFGPWRGKMSLWKAWKHARVGLRPPWYPPRAKPAPFDPYEHGGDPLDDPYDPFGF